MLNLNDMSSFNIGYKPKALSETLQERIFFERFLKINCVVAMGFRSLKNVNLNILEYMSIRQLVYSKSY